MKIGTQKLKYKVESILYENHVRTGRRRIAGEIVDAIMEIMGDDMSKKDWNLFHSFPQELEPVVLQLRQGFNFEPKRDEIAIETYTWLKEQGKEKLAAFIRWATDKERVQYVGKYRNNPGMIKNDWKLAFDHNAPAIIRNDDGSLNV
jgi:hypothetical protein